MVSEDRLRERFGQVFDLHDGLDRDAVGIVHPQGLQVFPGDEAVAAGSEVKRRPAVRSGREKDAHLIGYDAEFHLAGLGWTRR